MRQRLICGAAAVLTAAMAVACTGETEELLPPTVPSAAASGLKVGTPTPLSPIGGVSVQTQSPQLTVRAAKGLNGSPTVNYEFQVATTNGQVVYTRTGTTFTTANGVDTVGHTVTVLLPGSATFRWRSRAVSGVDAGPWSDFAGTNFTTNSLTAANSNDEFRDFFFQVVAAKGVAVPTAAAMAAMEADLVGVGIILAKGADGQPRGRIWLPSGLPNKYTRAVDVVTGFGGSSQWTWNFLGPRACEFICP